MKLHSLNCPGCGASLEIKENLTHCFCMYCGTKLVLDDENVTITINKNINIRKTTINRSIDDAAIEEARVRNRIDRRSWIGAFLCFALILWYPVYFFIGGDIRERRAESAGLVSAGRYDHLVGHDYKSVVAHFESAGFEDIVLIDLEDADGLFDKDGEVEQVSVAGNLTFGSDDYFSPDSQVVISYH